MIRARRTPRSALPRLLLPLLLLPILFSAPGCVDEPDDAAEEWLARLAGRSHAPAGRHWPVHPDRLTVYFPKLGRSVRIKWKAAPAGDADGWNNAPRKELVAYEIQKWFLRPQEYVVPTTVARCIALEDYRRLDPRAEPTLAGTQCVFGVQALWLAGVHVPDALYDEARFRREPVYARHLANFNLFAYLVDNRDTRKANVLTAENERNRRVFSVDNGISFDSKLYNFFQNEWKDVRVPALPRDSIQRLRGVTRERVAALATVAQFRSDGDGMLRPERPGPPLDPASGSRWRDGVLQLGLTESEIENVWQRLQALLAEIDAGEILLF